MGRVETHTHTRVYLVYAMSKRYLTDTCVQSSLRLFCLLANYSSMRFADNDQMISARRRRPRS